MATMLNPNAIQKGSITKDMIDASVLGVKQNTTDESLATTSKEVVGAINELFNGGVKDKSIEIGKLAQAVQDTLGKVGTNVKVLSSGTDLKTVEEAGVYILSGLKDYLNYPNKWEHYNTSILIVSGDGNNYNKGKTIIGFQSGSDYPFAATLRNNEWIETDLYTVLTNIKKDVTTFQGLINTKVKIINEDTDLNTLTKDGLYLLSAGHSYANYPLNDGYEGNSVYISNAALLIVSRQYIQTRISQVILSVSNVYTFPLARNRYYDGSNWQYWNDDRMYKDIWQGVINSVKKRDDNLATTSKEVIGAINELFNGGVKDKSIEAGKLTQAVQDTLKMVGTNVKEISYKSMGNQIPNIDDITETGIYILPDVEKYNGSTYSNLPADLRYSNVKLLIVSPTYQSSDYQRQTLIAINYSSLVGICTREAYTDGFVNIPFSYTSIQSAIEGKLDNTSSLTDTEVNNIWDNN